jgi:cytochrome c
MMRASPALYAQMGLLSVVLTAAIVFHYARHGLQRYPQEELWRVAAADTEQGRVKLHQFGCGACHVIPGIGGATGRVGPPLDRIHEKIYLAGIMPHTPQNLVIWIQRPREIDPQSAMPNLGVSEQDARDMAAYLYEHRRD